MRKNWEKNDVSCILAKIFLSLAMSIHPFTLEQQKTVNRQLAKSIQYWVVIILMHRTMWPGANTREAKHWHILLILLLKRHKTDKTDVAPKCQWVHVTMEWLSFIPITLCPPVMYLCIRARICIYTRHFFGQFLSLSEEVQHFWPQKDSQFCQENEKLVNFTPLS